MKHLAFAALGFSVAMLGLPNPSAANELDTPAWKAASFIKGVYTSYVDMLHACQEIDGGNVAAYNTAIIALATVATPALQQIEKVMRGEAERAGKDADWLAEANEDIDNIADLTAEHEKKYPKKMLSECRIAPEQAEAHSGIFASLRDQFPKEMHIVEQWH